VFISLLSVNMFFHIPFFLYSCCSSHSLFVSLFTTDIYLHISHGHVSTSFSYNFPLRLHFVAHFVFILFNMFYCERFSCPATMALASTSSWSETGSRSCWCCFQSAAYLTVPQAVVTLVSINNHGRTISQSHIIIISVRHALVFPRILPLIWSVCLVLKSRFHPCRLLR
jgi:hypothetical protein